MCLVRVLTKEQVKELSKLGEEERYKYIIKNIFQVAKTDIIVYKRLKIDTWNKDKLITPYYNYRMEPGFHYYQTENENKFSFFINMYRRLNVEQGLHSFTTLSNERMGLNNCNFLFKAIIPKGSLYLVGEFNETVSDNLIITNEAYYIEDSFLQKYAKEKGIIRLI